VLNPPAILAVGLNYSAHSSELGLKTDKGPTVFTLWPNSLTGHGQTTSWTRSLSESVDYEAELGVIIGRSAKNVSVENALDAVWGYTAVNDVTARDQILECSRAGREEVADEDGLLTVDDGELEVLGVASAQMGKPHGSTVPAHLPVIAEAPSRLCI
jgi:2-keto-4-pentenoate hydratase/2-oxohepta-3-ene-1,7-dioic acid hydratase in catechol pathway